MKPSLEQLLDHYQSLGFESYYDIILSNIKSDKKEFIQINSFLLGYHQENELKNDIIHSVTNDQRVDVPVWFGDLKMSKNKIMVFGLEPRDTNPLFNIEKRKQKIFATPFGIDRWNEESSVKRKPQNRYFRVFRDLVAKPENFVLFSDIVKDYQIVSSGNNEGKNDKNARASFFSKAEKQLPFLQQEISLVNPTHLVTLGNDSFTFLSKHFPGHSILRLRHPANGGENIAKKQLVDLKQ